MTLFFLLLGGLALIAGLLLLAAWVSLDQSCGRRDYDWTCPDALARTQFAPYAHMALAANAWLEKIPHQQVSIQSEDGLRLSARFVPAEGGKATIIACHGWRSTPLIDFGVAMELYHNLGFHLLIIDQRSHGASQGKWITFGVKERGDLHRWIDYVATRFGAAHPVLLSGVSMGASTVLMACGRDLPASVRAVVADSGFSSPKDIISKVVRDMHLPVKPVMAVMNLGARLFARFRLEAYSTLEAVPRMQVPVLFVHGTADTFVPQEMTEQAFLHCGSDDKQLLLVPGAKHGEGYLVDKTRYEAALFSLLRRTIPEVFE